MEENTLLPATPETSPQEHFNTTQPETGFEENVNAVQPQQVTSSIESVPPAQVSPPAVAAAAPADDKKKVLIIEDERPLAHALELKLGHSGFAAKAVNNGEDALLAIEAVQYDIILLDLILPGMDGFQLLKKIREKNTEAKVVILSNLGQPEDRARTEEYNITEYYIKSNVPLAAVVQSIQSLI